MFEQYLRIKEQYSDALLFFRMGDFYELFFEDADVAARELQIALTSRNPNSPEPIPMCGVPWHAAEGYISQLVNKGYKVAICEQVEDPRASKGLVERAVIRVHTAATAIEDASLEAKGHSFLASLYWNEKDGRGGVAWVDVSTGYWTGLHAKKLADVWQWAQKIAPRELLLPEGYAIPASLSFPDTQLVRVPVRSHFDLKRSAERLCKAQNVADIGALGLENRPELQQACGALLAYLEQTQMQSTQHLAPFKPLEPGRHLILDEVTERNLELFRRLDGRKGPGTLRQIIDSTLTPMGGRLLEESLRHPWREPDPIKATQDAVAWMAEHTANRLALREALKAVYDLERLSTRIAMNRTSPRDFLALRQSLAALPAVRDALFFSEAPYPTQAEARQHNLPDALYQIVSHWDDLGELSGLLACSLVDAPPPLITEGGLFRAGFDSALDELLDLVEHGEQKLQELLREEQKSSGIPKIKLGYNKVFGHYFEISKAVGTPAPAHFVRRQTLLNAERFTTPALSELEERLSSASEQRKQMEYKLFQKLREDVASMRERIVFMADLLARLDYWQSLAETAAKWNWCRPELDDSTDITIQGGRHPVVEAIMGSATFVPNDLRMDDNRRLLLITGPNMAGKSTILRQTALICILAQMGSFVPARAATLGLCDRIFSRVGASDNLAQGQSTFMVEMMETARILRQAGRRSLVILDEIGRGTSTFDGLALAQAVVEDIVKRAGGCIRTLFATHYHELTSLEGLIPGLHTMNVAITERNGELTFMRRLVPGPSDRSYGIEVARLAGVPQSVVQRARAILATLEQPKGAQAAPPPPQATFLPGMPVPEPRPELPKPEPVPVEHPLVTSLRDLEPDGMTPLQAFQILCEWKTLWGTTREAE